MSLQERADDANSVMEALLISPPDFFVELDRVLNQASEGIAGAASVLRSNLQSNLEVAGLPFMLTHESIHAQRANSFLAGERIRQEKYKDREEALKNSEAIRIARDRMHDFAISDEGRSQMIESTLNNLMTIIGRPDLKKCLQELLLETVVMLWGTFEVFVTDVVRCIANANPAKAAELFTGKTKKYLPAGGIAIDDLLAHRFDLSGAMGDILLANVRLDSLRVMKDMLRVLCPDANSLHEKMEDKSIWLFWQRRNLIAHRRGVADQSYIVQTGDNISVGQRLALTGRYVESCAVLARDTAIEIILAVKQINAS